MEKLDMMEQGLVNYLHIRPGKIEVDIILADGKRIEGIRKPGCPAELD